MRTRVLLSFLKAQTAPVWSTVTTLPYEANQIGILDMSTSSERGIYVTNVSGFSCKIIFFTYSQTILLWLLFSSVERFCTASCAHCRILFLSKIGGFILFMFSISNCSMYNSLRVVKIIPCGIFCSSIESCDKCFCSHACYRSWR